MAVKHKGVIYTVLPTKNLVNLAADEIKHYMESYCAEGGSPDRMAAYIGKHRPDLSTALQKYLIHNSSGSLDDISRIDTGPAQKLVG